MLQYMKLMVMNIDLRVGMQRVVLPERNGILMNESQTMLPFMQCGRLKVLLSIK